MVKVVNQKTIGFENLLKEIENKTGLHNAGIRAPASRNNLVPALSLISSPRT